MGEVDLPHRSGSAGARKEKFRSAAQIEREVIARHQADKKGRAANQHKKFFMTKKVKDEIAAEVALEQARREDAAKLAERTREENAGELDILAHPVWDRLLLAPTQELPLDAFFESEEARQRVEDLEGGVASCCRRCVRLAVSDVLLAVAGPCLKVCVYLTKVTSLRLYRRRGGGGGPLLLGGHGGRVPRARAGGGGQRPAGRAGGRLGAGELGRARARQVGHHPARGGGGKQYRCTPLLRRCVDVRV
jgi:hypothetical protein